MLAELRKLAATNKCSRPERFSRRPRCRRKFTAWLARSLANSGSRPIKCRRRADRKALERFKTKSDP